MTDNFYKKGIYRPDPTTYGGEITSFDFDGHPTLSSEAAKISKNQRFDRMCRINKSNRSRTFKAK